MSYFTSATYQQLPNVKLTTGGTAGRDAWFGIRRGRKDAKGQQSLESAATLTSGACFWLVFRQIYNEKLT